MADDEGVLGNLPNSRPGKRSAKREAAAGRPAKTAARAASNAERKGKPAARPARSQKQPKRHEPAPRPPAEDPVGAVVRTAAGVAATGVKVAGAVTQELLRRLPRR
jgi:hypothetical protein